MFIGCFKHWERTKMPIDARVRSGKYVFQTGMICGIGDVFEAENGHVGIITGIGPGDREPTVAIKQIKHKAHAGARSWIALSKSRRRKFRGALRDELAMWDQGANPTHKVIHDWAADPDLYKTGHAELERREAAREAAAK